MNSDCYRLAETIAALEAQREVLDDGVMNTVIPIVWKMLLVYIRG